MQKDMQFERGSSIRHGQIVYLHELEGWQLKDGEESFRVFGRLVKFDPEGERVVLQHRQHQLEIDTKLIPVGVEFKLHGQYQVIGECVSVSALDKLYPQPLQTKGKVIMLPLVMRARVARCVEGMNLALFEKALELRRKFEQEQGPNFSLPTRTADPTNTPPAASN